MTGLISVLLLKEQANNCTGHSGVLHESWMVILSLPHDLLFYLILNTSLIAYILVHKYVQNKKPFVTGSDRELSGPNNQYPLCALLASTSCIWKLNDLLLFNSRFSFPSHCNIVAVGTISYHSFNFVINGTTAATCFVIYSLFLAHLELLGFFIISSKLDLSSFVLLQRWPCHGSLWEAAASCPSSYCIGEQCHCFMGMLLPVFSNRVLCAEFPFFRVVKKFWHRICTLY